MYKSNDFLNASSPDSGLSLFSFFSCFFVPTAPNKIQSTLPAFIEVSFGYGVP